MTDRMLYISVSHSILLHVSIEREQDRQPGKIINRFYFPTAASRGRLERLIKELGRPPFVALNQDRIGLVYDVPKGVSPSQDGG